MVGGERPAPWPWHAEKQDHHRCGEAGPRRRALRRRPLQPRRRRAWHWHVVKKESKCRALLPHLRTVARSELFELVSIIRLRCSCFRSCCPSLLPQGARHAKRRSAYLPPEAQRISQLRRLSRQPPIVCPSARARAAGEATPVLEPAARKAALLCMWEVMRWCGSAAQRLRGCDAPLCQRRVPDRYTTPASRTLGAQSCFVLAAGCGKSVRRSLLTSRTGRLGFCRPRFPLPMRNDSGGGVHVWRWTHGLG